MNLGALGPGGRICLFGLTVAPKMITRLTNRILVPYPEVYCIPRMWDKQRVTVVAKVKLSNSSRTRTVKIDSVMAGDIHDHINLG